MSLTLKLWAQLDSALLLKSLQQLENSKSVTDPWLHVRAQYEVLSLNDHQRTGLPKDRAANHPKF